jgi:hypothetical protein
MKLAKFRSTENPGKLTEGNLEDTVSPVTANKNGLSNNLKCKTQFYAGSMQNLSCSKTSWKEDEARTQDA